MRLTSFVLGLVMASVFQTSTPPPRNLGEITVERINVVDHNGKLRLVISNRDRMHPGVIDGVTVDRKRSEAGLLFFNDQGDEVGGLTYRGEMINGKPLSLGTFTFDQWKQDQTIGIRYNESNGQRSAALEVWDRPEQSLGALVKQLNDARKIADAAERTAAEQRARSGAPPAPRRLYVGKTIERAATVSLSDGNGKPRLNLTVDANGNPRIELLDENGKVTNRWPAQQ
jgi:hypothetical protein